MATGGGKQPPFRAARARRTVHPPTPLPNGSCGPPPTNIRGQGSDRQTQIHGGSGARWSARRARTRIPPPITANGKTVLAWGLAGNRMAGGGGGGVKLSVAARRPPAHGQEHVAQHRRGNTWGSGTRGPWYSPRVGGGEAVPCFTVVDVTGHATLGGLARGGRQADRCGVLDMMDSVHCPIPCRMIRRRAQHRPRAPTHPHPHG